MPPLTLNENEITRGVKHLKPYTQVIFHPHTLGDVQMAVVQSFPMNVIFTPHPKIEFLHLMSNLENLNSLAIYMPLIDEMYSNTYLMESLDALNPDAIFMPHLGLDDNMVLFLLERLRLNALFMPHPEIFEEFLFNILCLLPEHIRYVPNVLIDIATNQFAIECLSDYACITIHPQASVTFTNYILSCTKHSHELKVHRETSKELYQSLKIQLDKNKEINIVDSRFIHHHESLAMAIGIISSMKKTATYEPHYSLALDTIIECFKFCPEMTIFKPHPNMPSQILFQLLSSMPTHIIFSPHINLPVEKFLQALDYVPTNCKVYANTQTPFYLLRNTRILPIFITHDDEIEEYLNNEDSTGSMIEKPEANRP